MNGMRTSIFLKKDMLCIKSQENERFLNGLYILMGMGICRLSARRDGEVMVTTMKVQTSEDGF